MTVRTLRLFRASKVYLHKPRKFTSPKWTSDSSSSCLFKDPPPRPSPTISLVARAACQSHSPVRRSSNSSWPALSTARRWRLLLSHHAIWRGRAGRNRKEAGKTLLFINLNFKAESEIFKFILVWEQKGVVSIFIKRNVAPFHTTNTLNNSRYSLET